MPQIMHDLTRSRVRMPINRTVDIEKSCMTFAAHIVPRFPSFKLMVRQHFRLLSAMPPSSYTSSDPELKDPKMEPPEYEPTTTLGKLVENSVGGGGGGGLSFLGSVEGSGEAGLAILFNGVVPKTRVPCWYPYIGAIVYSITKSGPNFEHNPIVIEPPPPNNSLDYEDLTQALQISSLILCSC